MDVRYWSLRPDCALEHSMVRLDVFGFKIHLGPFPEFPFLWPSQSAYSGFVMFLSPRFCCRAQLSYFGSDHVLWFWLSISLLSRSQLSALGTGLALGLPASQVVAANTPLQQVAFPRGVWAGRSESSPALSSGGGSSSHGAGIASLERGMYQRLRSFWQKQQQKGPSTVNITSNTLRSRQRTGRNLLLAVTFYCRKSCLRPFFTLLADEHSHLPICQKRPLGGDSPPPRQL